MRAPAASHDRGMAPAESDHRVAELLRAQSGVIARFQLRELGIAEHVLQRWLRNRHVTRVAPGVYVDHTGEPTGVQRAWAAVLSFWPAALGGRTALQLALGREPGEMIEVVVQPDRSRLRPREGVRVVRRQRTATEVNWNLRPPRLRVEQAALDVASSLGESYAAVEVLAEVCRERITTPDRLLAALADRPRARNRAFLEAALEDVREGATSVLERGYLQLERAHGLPRATRQRAETLGGIRPVRDAEYEQYGLVIELDGQAYHSGRQRQRDLARDLEVSLDNRTTLRLGWGQVVDDGCATAAKVCAMLAARGWRGRPRPCSPGCAVADAA